MNTRQLTKTALLLALCVASQFLKNLSVYITGPIINCILIAAVVFCGLPGGITISLVTPLTSWLITGSPLMSALPLIIPCVMLGNLLLALSVWVCTRKAKEKKHLLWGILSGAILKAAFMGASISLLILPLLGAVSGLPAPAIAAARVTFSLTQLITALIGGALAMAVVTALRHTGKQ